MLNKALFLDRDGVINCDYGYVHSFENFDFIDGIFELVNYAHSKGYLILVVTNQAGIGRNLYTKSDFKRLTSWMCEEFDQRNAPISKVYYCASHPTMAFGKYKKDDLRRKPNPGMILEAKTDFNLDLSSSFLVGDRETDILAGKNAGLGTSEENNST